MKLIHAIPALPVRDTTASVGFYCEQFGFTVAPGAGICNRGTR